MAASKYTHKKKSQLDFLSVHVAWLHTAAVSTNSIRFIKQETQLSLQQWTLFILASESYFYLFITFSLSRIVTSYFKFCVFFLCDVSWPRFFWSKL